eukprot:COSAG02_NODE_29097_length_576_cov_0.863732_1_plen_176_part_10
MVFEDCMYAPDGYQLFVDALDDGLADYEPYSQEPVREFLSGVAAQQPDAWVAVPEYLHANNLSGLSVGSPVIHIDSGMAGEVSECLRKGEYAISLYVDNQVDGPDATSETINAVVDRLLTVDQNFVDAYILRELEAGTGELFGAKQEKVARSAERGAAVSIARAQQDAAEKKERDS